MRRNHKNHIGSPCRPVFAFPFVAAVSQLGSRKLSYSHINHYLYDQCHLLFSARADAPRCYSFPSQIAMFLVTSPIVIVPTRTQLAVETITSFVPWLANLNIKRNVTSTFVNKKYRYTPLEWRHNNRDVASFLDGL